MNAKVIGGIVVVVAIAVAAYFIFFSGGRCSESAMRDLAPKVQEALTKKLQEDPSKAEEYQKMAQDMIAKMQSGDESGACNMVYDLADKLGVK